MTFPATESLLLSAAGDGRARAFLSVAAATVDLEPWPLPTMATEGCEVDGAPARHGRVLWKSSDDRAVLLIEELGPCTLRGRHGGELLFFLEGLVRARPGDGSPEYTIRAGDVSWFEPGLWDEWVIEETYRKVLYVATDRPLPY